MLPLIWTGVFSPRKIRRDKIPLAVLLLTLGQGQGIIHLGGLVALTAERCS